jgi:hypothetical protein
MGSKARHRFEINHTYVCSMTAGSINLSLSSGASKSATSLLPSSGVSLATGNDSLLSPDTAHRGRSHSIGDFISRCRGSSKGSVHSRNDSVYSTTRASSPIGEPDGPHQRRKSWTNIFTVSDENRSGKDII